MVLLNFTRKRPSVSEQVVGACDGLSVGARDGTRLVVGACDGLTVGASDGTRLVVGASDGLNEGAKDGTRLVVGAKLGSAVLQEPSFVTVIVSDSSLT